MYAKLILLAEDIAFDDLGRISAKNLSLDVFVPSFPATLEKLDLLTLWTRGQEEAAKQLVELSLRVGDNWLPPETIPVEFGEDFEAFRGISLDGFQIDAPGPVIFRFHQQGEDRGVWIMRVHPMPSASETADA
jgi:hypothetical protein